MDTPFVDMHVHSFYSDGSMSPNEIVLCLDNDTAGREAAALMAGKYAAKGYTVLIDFPHGKDFLSENSDKKSNPR